MTDSPRTKRASDKLSDAVNLAWTLEALIRAVQPTEQTEAVYRDALKVAGTLAIRTYSAFKSDGGDDGDLRANAKRAFKGKRIKKEWWAP